MFLDQATGLSTTLQTSEVDAQTGIPHCVYSAPGVQLVIDDQGSISDLAGIRSRAVSGGFQVTDTPQLGPGSFRAAQQDAASPGASLCTEVLPGQDQRIVSVTVTAIGGDSACGPG